MSADGPRRSFLERWSKLKREAGQPPPPAGEAAEPPSPGGAPLSEEARQAQAAELEARLATLPKLEDIGAETDISVFLQDWVPHPLRNAALRAVWSSDPRIANFIEVAECQYDWNVPGGAPGCGPLEPDFDLEAAVRRIFREETPQREEGRDCLSQVAHADARQAADFAASQHALTPETPVLPMVNTTNVVDENANATTAPVQGQDAVQHEQLVHPETGRTPRRRHGGALPEKRS